MRCRFPSPNSAAYTGEPETALWKFGFAFPAFPTSRGRRACDHQLMPAAVLIVDDDPWFRRVAIRLLESAGLSVAGEAGSASEAIAAVEALAPGAVLLDVGLPDGDGVSLAGKLAALPSRPRVVLTSSDPDAVTHELAQRSGADAFVPKHELTDVRLHALFGVS